ncbi:MAG: hypothetical protein ACYDA8_02280 [Deferrisomatales bacterium]
MSLLQDVKALSKKAEVLENQVASLAPQPAWVVVSASEKRPAPEVAHVVVSAVPLADNHSFGETGLSIHHQDLPVRSQVRVPEPPGDVR